MRAKRYASAVWQMVSSSESRASVKDALKRALDSAEGSAVPARMAARRTRAVVRAARSIVQIVHRQSPEDDVAEQWFLPVTDEEVRAANDACLKERLPKDFEALLAHHTEFLPLASLPQEPLAMLDVRAGQGAPPFGIYCDRQGVVEKKLMELGCGCGYFGKMMARHAKSYVGTDYSTAALKIARLVSPSNTSYVHPKKQSSLAAHHQTVNTVVGRDLFVHHNLDGARDLLGFIEPFLVRGGRLYAAFYWPDPDRAQDDVYPAVHPPTDHPSSMFAYARSDIERLIDKRPFKIVREDVRPAIQRRFAVLEKTAYLD